MGLSLTRDDFHRLDFLIATTKYLLLYTRDKGVNGKGDGGNNNKEYADSKTHDQW